MPDQPTPMYCLDCRYQLNGLVGLQCPECGRNFSPRVRSSFSPFSQRTDIFAYLGHRLPKIMVALGLANTVLAGLVWLAVRFSGSALVINWLFHGFLCLLLGLVLGRFKAKRA